MPEIVSLYEQGSYDAARDRLLALEDGGDAHLYRAERGIVELARGEPGEATDALRASRDRMAELSSDSFFGSLGSMLLDDRQLDWSGADYEKVLIRAILAVADLMAGGRDANAYAIQVLERQREIIDAYVRDGGEKPKQDYKLVAFGSYLRAILNEEKPSARDEARLAFEQVAELEPDWPYAQADLERVRNGRHSDPGNGVLHVLGFVGLAPARVESTEPVSATALAIAQAIWIHNQRTGGIPNLTSVAIPALAFQADNPTSLVVSIDGNEVAHTETITDVNLCAQAEFEAIQPDIVARAVLRRAFKIAVTEGVKATYGENSNERSDKSMAIDFAVSLLGMLWTGVESADLRSWHLLPAYLQAVRIELPAGEYMVTLRAARDRHATGAPQQVRVRVRDGFNTYVLGIAPTLAGGAPPLTSDPARETLTKSTPP